LKSFFIRINSIVDLFMSFFMSVRINAQISGMFEALEEWMLDDLLDMARQFDYTVNLILNKHLKEINVIKVLSKVQKQRNLLQEPYSIWLTLPDPNN